MKPKIVFFGSDSFVIPVLQALYENFEVQAVVTSPNSPIEQIAKTFNIPVLTPDKLTQEFLNDHISLLTSDLFVVASYGKIIPQSFLDIPKFGGLNIHPSLLPKYRGPSPLQNTILNGDKESGVTIIKMDSEMDHGQILLASNFSLSGQETFEILGNKLFQLGAETLISIIPDFIEGKIALKEQNHADATFTKMVKKEDGYFEIDNPPLPEILERMIRAYHPWPGVWTKWNGKIVKLLPENMIQMEGKKPQTLKDFLNGYQDFPLKVFTQ